MPDRQSHSLFLKEPPQGAAGRSGAQAFLPPHLEPSLGAVSALVPRRMLQRPSRAPRPSWVPPTVTALPALMRIKTQRPAERENPPEHSDRIRDEAPFGCLSPSGPHCLLTHRSSVQPRDSLPSARRSLEPEKRSSRPPGGKREPGVEASRNGQ